MAKTKTKTRTAMAPYQGFSPRAQMALARAAPVAKRVGGAAKAAAMSEKHTLTALATAGALAYLDKEGKLDGLQVVDSVGPIATVGVGLWVAGRFSKNSMLQHAATGALSIALFNAVKEA